MSDEFVLHGVNFEIALITHYSSLITNHFVYLIFIATLLTGVSFVVRVLA